MANGGNRRYIVNQAVVAGVTLVNEPTQTVFLELVIIARQVVPTHLVNHNTNHELRLFAEFRTRHHLNRQTQRKNKPQNFLHILTRSMISKHIRPL